MVERTLSPGTDRQPTSKTCNECERAMSSLLMYGVPAERARTVANGIGVLATRCQKSEWHLNDEIERLRALLKRTQRFIYQGPPRNPDHDSESILSAEISAALEANAPKPPAHETGVIVSTAGDELNGESPRAGASVGQPSPAVGHAQKPALDSDGRVSSHPSFCRCEACAHPVPAPHLKAAVDWRTTGPPPNRNHDKDCTCYECANLLMCRGCGHTDGLHHEGCPVKAGA